MTYTKALETARRVGAKHADGAAHLAQVCQVLTAIHAVNAEMLYNGARKLGLDGNALAKLAHENVGEFAFVQFA